MRTSNLRKIDLDNLKKLFDGFLLDWNEIQHHTGYSEKECRDILASIQRIQKANDVTDVEVKLTQDRRRPIV